MTETTIPAHLAHLPVRRGLPVPWVASWTAEQDSRLVHVEWTSWGPRGRRGTAIAYGVLWLDTGMLRMGVGEPDFGSTSSHRQRRSMKGRCQVCGTRLPSNEPWLWIIPGGNGWVGVTGRPFETKQPPVCPPCAATAPQWCPHLRNHPWQLFRASATPVAAVGQALYHPDEDVAEGVVVDLDDPTRRYLLGRELIVRLDDPVEVTP